MAERKYNSPRAVFWFLGVIDWYHFQGPVTASLSDGLMVQAELDIAERNFVVCLLLTFPPSFVSIVIIMKWKGLKVSLVFSQRNLLRRDALKQKIECKNGIVDPLKCGKGIFHMVYLIPVYQCPRELHIGDWGEGGKVDSMFCCLVLLFCSDTLSSSLITFVSGFAISQE